MEVTARHCVVFIILDAFRWDYLNTEDAPLLAEMAEGGIHCRKVVTSPGFAQRSSIFCGAYPDATGNYAMYAFDPKGSPFRGILSFPSLVTLDEEPWINHLPRIKGIRYLQRRAQYRRGVKRQEARKRIERDARKYAVHAPASHIPFGVLPFLNVSEDQKEINSTNALGTESIFDLCAESGVRIEYLMFPVVNCEDDLVLTKAIERVESGARFFLLQFSDSDLKMHLAGTSTLERRKVVGELDRKIRALKKVFDADFPSTTWVIIGDHGMMDVEKEVNVADIVHGEARRRGLKHIMDYLLFLDSTVARIWSLSNKAEALVPSVFVEQKSLRESGRLLTPETARQYRMPFGDRRYGDCIWLANPGTLIFPDYFHDATNHNKAMHGYDRFHDDMKGMAIVYGKDIPPRMIEEVQLVDICPTLCDLLRVRYPQKCEGKSIFAVG